MKIYCSKRKLSQTLITLFLFTHTHTYTCTYLICKHVICHYILLLMSYTFTRLHTNAHLYILATGLPARNFVFAMQKYCIASNFIHSTNQTLTFVCRFHNLCYLPTQLHTNKFYWS